MAITRFLKYELRKGTEIIAVISGVAAVAFIVALILGLVFGTPHMQQHGTPAMGEEKGFVGVSILLIIVNFMHAVCCYIMSDFLHDNTIAGVRVWIRSAVAQLAVWAVFVPFLVAVLYAAGAAAAATLLLAAFAAAFPASVYLLMVVYSYHTSVCPGHSWRIWAREAPRSCITVEHAPSDHAVVVVLP